LATCDVEELDREIESLIHEFAWEIRQEFIVETPEKLRRIVLHFRSLLGQAQAIAPVCNAPWVSAVIDSDGSVLPCFFHPAIGNLRENPLIGILNDRAAMEFRKQLDIPSNRICQRCVCSLNLPQAGVGGN
jgi:Fe-coproporphyrin III synthase